MGVVSELSALPRGFVSSSTKLLVAYARQPGANFIFFIWALFAFLHAYVIVVGIPAGMWDHMWQYKMDDERGIPEFWEFIILLVSSALLALRSVQKKRYAYLVPAAMLFYMAIDGRLQIHEAVGERIWPERIAGGEFIFMATMGAAFLLSLAYVIWRSSAVQKAELICYAILLVLFGLFGSIFDVLHALLGGSIAALDKPMAWLEDGGELLIISLMLILSLGVFKRLGSS